MRTLFITLLLCLPAYAQETLTRPRRVNPPPASTTIAAAAPSADITRARVLLESNNYLAADEIATRLIAADPTDAAAWELAGYARFNLKRYTDAADALTRARELRRAAGAADDPQTTRALAQTLVYADRHQEALPLLILATDAAPVPATLAERQERARLFYMRGFAEQRTGKANAAESSFTNASRLDPRNAPALFQLGRLAYDQGQLAKSIIMLNRATLIDSRLADAWRLLSIAYLRRAAEAETRGQETANLLAAEADRASAVRASESLVRADNTVAAAELHAQALIVAKQYKRAADYLERFAARNSAAPLSPTSLYLVGVAHSRVKNYPAAIRRLEQAAANTEADASTHAELGYAYEVTRQYAKALAAYERAAQLAPTDLDLAASIARVRPQVK